MPQRGVGLGLGATVFVVSGWVPEGEALGRGVTVLVGSGVVWSGVTVAVGRGPAGMLGVGMGVAVSSGEFASAPTASAEAAIRAAKLEISLTITASGATPSGDVIA